MSACTSPDTARDNARSRVSFTTMKPSGLSSRTTSPTSVIHDVEAMPPKLVRTLKAGTGRPAARTTSRCSTSTVMGALRSVAGSKTGTSRWRPGRSPAAARRRDRLRLNAGGSVSSRVSLRVPDGVCTVMRKVVPVDLPADRDGPRPRVEGEVERPQLELAVDDRGRVQARRRGGAEERHLQPAVLLQLVAVVAGDRLSDQEPDLLAAGVHALPLRAGAVAGEIGAQGHRGGLEVALGEDSHLRDPGHDDEEGEEAGDAAWQGAEQRQRVDRGEKAIPGQLKAFCG